MAAEFREAPDVVRRQRSDLVRPLTELVTLLRHAGPRLVITCARGSSAHAATFAKHLIEKHVGIPVSDAAPNIMSVYRKRLKLDGQLFIVISQSGRSDDLIEMTEMANAAGALTAAIVNETESPLAAASKIVLPMAAGLERSIAATKSFVATAAVLLRFVAAWTNDTVFMSAIERLPDRLESAADLEWTSAVRSLVDATSLAIIGRGPTLAIAREAALKLKETSSLHAEGFSSAEFQHGPIALITRHYPVLLFTPTDEAAVGMMELAASLDMKGASVFMTGDVPGLPNRLPTLPPDYPETDALCLVQSFYRLAVRIAEARGYDADQPRHVTKVTRTR